MLGAKAVVEGEGEGLDYRVEEVQGERQKDPSLAEVAKRDTRKDATLVAVVGRL